MMPSHKFAEWLAYERLEPFGEERADLRAAIIASSIVNVFAAKGRTVKLKDFMIDWDAEPEAEMTDQQVFEKMKAAFKAIKLRKSKEPPANSNV